MKRAMILMPLALLLCLGSCGDKTADTAKTEANESSSTPQSQSDLVAAFERFNYRSPTMNSVEDKMSYQAGYEDGKALSHSGFKIDVDLYLLGMIASQNGLDPLFTRDEVKDMMKILEEREIERMRNLHKKQGTENQAKGEEFLKQKAQEEGVVALPSGVHYKVLKEGNGVQPDESKIVEMHYRIKLIDGTEVNSSYEVRMPQEYKVNQLMKGMIEGIQLMREGGHNIFYIPAALAFGERGTGDIPPGSTIVFEAELLRVMDGFSKSKF